MVAMRARSRNPTTGEASRESNSSRFFLRQHRRFAFPDGEPGAPDGGGGVRGDDLAHDQPVEEHADGCQVLLDRGLRQAFAQHFDIGRHVQGLNIEDLREVLRVHTTWKTPEPHGDRLCGCWDYGYWRQSTR